MSDQGNTPAPQAEAPAPVEAVETSAPPVVEATETPDANLQDVIEETQNAALQVAEEAQAEAPQYDAHIQAFEAHKAAEAKKKNLQMVKDIKTGAKSIKQFERSSNTTTESASKFTSVLSTYLRVGKTSHIMDLYKKDPAAYDEFITAYIQNSGNLAAALVNGALPTDFIKSQFQRLVRVIPGTESVNHLTDKHTILLVNFMVASGVLPAPEHVAQQAEKNISRIVSDTSLALGALGALSTATGIGSIGGVPLGTIAMLGGTVDQLVYKDFIKGLAKERKARASEHIPNSVAPTPQAQETANTEPEGPLVIELSA